MKELVETINKLTNNFGALVISVLRSDMMWTTSWTTLLQNIIKSQLTIKCVHCNHESHMDQ